ncbi:glycosyltransferase family 4 protein [Roseomonas xinghualingensis]|uniref:glycosyltransferase family 4 protein n=1 Tax=Roseomonas xinghualingensis TaxID=2986475 RepID=UPI0021F11DFC|nr:glycosyltransferase family 1 protein [Roseomonas sp. SXEYE001]MCV4208360.1 glycosyltransferase family 4 protein [Roseomonas sp. SXEYE001]
MILWLDVEDLFHYALRNPRPSGIQRLSYEMYAELHALLGNSVRFCRHDPMSDTLRTVPWEAVHRLFAGLLEPAPTPARPQPAAAPRIAKVTERASLMRVLARRLPLEMRDPLAQGYAAQRLALSAQLAALRHGTKALRGFPLLLRSPTARVGEPHVEKSAEEENTQVPVPEGQDIRDLAGPGDVLCVLGSPWFHPDYAGFIRKATAGRSMQTALLVYDLIPLLRPEWCDAGLVRVFRRWFEGFAPQADHLFAISDATARDVERWAAREHTRLSLPVRTLPIGTGFSGPPVPAAESLPAGLRPGGYALIVSTIEARKNHLLAFRAWRRMVEEMPPETVPPLVFAGRVGWLVQDLMRQLENCRYLDGKIVVVPDPTDSELITLYRGCRFTLFPSLYEGWGLPVTESLSFGKLCIASNRTSVPEAGGDFCLYIDPENITEATETIRRACTDDTLIAEREAAIRDGFKPVSWRRSAEALAAHLGAAPS